MPQWSREAGRDRFPIRRIERPIFRRVPVNSHFHGERGLDRAYRTLDLYIHSVAGTTGDAKTIRLGKSNHRGIVFFGWPKLGGKLRHRKEMTVRRVRGIVQILQRLIHLRLVSQGQNQIEAHRLRFGHPVQELRLSAGNFLARVARQRRLRIQRRRCRTKECGGANRSRHSLEKRSSEAFYFPGHTQTFPPPIYDLFKKTRHPIQTVAAIRCVRHPAGANACADRVRRPPCPSAVNPHQPIVA